MSGIDQTSDDIITGAEVVEGFLLLRRANGDTVNGGYVLDSSPSIPASQFVHYKERVYFDSDSLNSGIEIFTPHEGMILLDGWLEIEVAFDGTTPKWDMGTFDEVAEGIFSAGGTPIPVAAPNDDVGYAIDPHLDSCQNNGIQSLMAASIDSGARYLPARFNSDITFKIVISQTGMSGGAAIGGTAGVAVAHVLVCPVVGDD